MKGMKLFLNQCNFDKIDEWVEPINGSVLVTCMGTLYSDTLSHKLHS